VITYVDTSSLIKLLIEEEGSDHAALIWDTADAVASAVLVTVEARAALAAAERARRLTPREHGQAKRALAQLVDDLNLVGIDDRLIDHAGHLAEQEALRGNDALHLAAALALHADVLTSTDADLCDAGRRCGLHVANPIERPGTN
jgi:predicted nucleic acid-binding protein